MLKINTERWIKPQSFDITDKGIKINNLEVKDDNIITIIQNNLILKQGKIKFGFYEDSSHKEHYWHLGYYIIWADGSIQTLADALRDLEINHWEWLIEEVKENEARNNSS